jgi:hypothetical protein
MFNHRLRTSKLDKNQEVAIDHTSSWGNDYRLDDIPLHVHASVDNSLNRNGLLKNAEVSVYYVSTRPSNAYGKTTYPEHVIEFDDNNLWVKSHRNYSVVIYSSPPEDVLDQFRRVHLGYRDIFNITWDKANEVLSRPILNVSFALSLSDKTLKNFDIESVWYVRYSDGEDIVEYWVDAQSGKIVHEMITR